MTLRASSWACFIAGAFCACGGRAALSEASESAPAPAEGGAPEAGAASSSWAGTGGTLVEPAAGRAGQVGEGRGKPDAGEAGTAGDGGGGGGAPSVVAGMGNVAGAGGPCAGNPGRFASEVLSHSFGGGQNFNQAAGFPQAIFGPPAADDTSSVVSLGNGGWVVVGFGGNAIVDGPGIDFTVFENPLPTFKELGTVAVSDDAQHWTEFPCTAAQDASDYGFCAGVGVVYSSPKNGIDPLDPRVSGGDHYDLADIGVSHARFVRITDRVDLTGVAGVFDLDAVAIINAECP